MASDRVTMEDVAARAGVSRALVSIVFRGVAGASDATRERVLAAARELDYRPDTRASRLGRSRTRMIGVTFSVGAAFHGDLLQSLYTHADAAGYEVVLSGVTPERSESAAVETLLAERCEAIVALGSTLGAGELGRLAAQLPVVSVLRAVSGGVDVVRTDDAAGLQLAVAHLVELGHERIALLDGGRAAGAAERRRGYRAGLRRAGGLPEHVYPGGLTELEGASSATEFLALERDRPTAVTAFNDRCALGFIDVVRQAGLRVPHDVSVVGFDDISQAAYPHVGLTTVRQDAEQLGTAAIRTVDARLSGAAPGPATVIDPELVVRTSTAPLLSGG
ncbi:LacI family DNA-binding transcriptional regulator [Humibacillus xanthopallidus]|uniref:LacI family transcriptional regulator n=1 Tax=Humibacillus xanthopallidus TaxID=412689 RepID=A0A543I2N8_9MICO|nr:LacI family DNA-binding transcriptional regulator [Humibacillus xanthopallidus]TQM64827.1 LacI family transcriptional regulator [Humibacillus xanthopallidus]